MRNSDADASARSLADAFGDDPVMGWAGKFDDNRERLVPLWRLIINFRIGKSDPLLFTTEDNEANAVWDAPGDADLATIDLVKGLPSMLRSFRTGVPRLLRMLHAMDKAHPKEPHYYLLAIGVSHTHQGRGLGSAVIQPMQIAVIKRACLRIWKTRSQRTKRSTQDTDSSAEELSTSPQGARQ